MSLDQKRARWFGVLYLITFVTSIAALALYETVLRHPVSYIAGAGHDNQVLLGALLELLLIIANIGTAVVIVPIMRRRFEDLSIGYVTARIVECGRRDGRYWRVDATVADGRRRTPADRSSRESAGESSARWLSDSAWHSSRR